MQRTLCELLPFSLDEALGNQLRTLGQQQNCSLFMVLLAAVSILLERYSGQKVRDRNADCSPHAR